MRDYRTVCFDSFFDDAEPKKCPRCGNYLLYHKCVKNNLCESCAEADKRIVKEWKTEASQLRKYERAEKCRLDAFERAEEAKRLRVRKKFLKMLTVRQYYASVELNAYRKDYEATLVAIRKLEKHFWYVSNPPRTCAVCGTEKRLFDFKKDRETNKYGGFTCRTCLNRKRERVVRSRRVPKPRKPAMSAEERAAKRKLHKVAYKIKARQDPMHRINMNFSNRIRTHFRRFNAGKPLGGWKALVGYSLKDLKHHLENKFTDGMSWENYGEWHIDHIRPKASFSFTSADDPQFIECWSLDNLQPLWAEDNVVKGATWEEP